MVYLAEKAKKCWNPISWTAMAILGNMDSVDKKNELCSHHLAETCKEEALPCIVKACPPQFQPLAKKRMACILDVDPPEDFLDSVDKKNELCSHHITETGKEEGLSCIVKACLPQFQPLAKKNGMHFGRGSARRFFGFRG